MTATQFVALVEAALEPHRNPAQAEPMVRYMRDLFPFLGLKRPQHDLCLKPIWPLIKPHATEKLVLTAAARLWKLPEREYQYVAIELQSRNVKVLTADSLPAIRKLLESKSWWDSVDPLSSWVLGPLIQKFPELRLEMDRWAKDENFWVRRAAIIHQIGCKQHTDIERLFDYCVINAKDPEFFIRKAIGWALRQYAYTDAKAVAKFVAAHPELSPLSKREALKHVLSSRS